MVSDRTGTKIDFHNATGYVLEIQTGLTDICTRLRQPHARSFEASYCKRAIARPAIGTLLLLVRLSLSRRFPSGLAIVGVIFLVIGTVCTGRVTLVRLLFPTDSLQRSPMKITSTIERSAGYPILLLFSPPWVVFFSSHRIGRIRSVPNCNFPASMFATATPAIC